MIARPDPEVHAEKVPVKSVDLPKAPAETLSGLATNFLLPERTKPMPVITDRQEKIIRGMLKRQIVTRYSGKTRAALLEAMGTGEPGSVRKAWTGVGQLSQDGRLYLFGQVLVGSTSDVHYASPGDEPVFGSLLVIAEQQSDRTFKAVAVPDLEKEDCYADGPLDVDGDGTDEIVLTCRAVEGPDSSGLLPRVGGHWVGEF